MSKPTRRPSDLREERQANALPWSLTPFVHDSGSGLTVSDADEEPRELEPGELRVKAPEEVPWIGNSGILHD